MIEGEADRSAEDLARRLEAIVGSGHVLDAPEDLDYYSSDIFERGLLAERVVRPATPDEVARVIGACTQADRAVIPRGAGLSYTGGYLPVRERSILVDLGRLNRILEINAEDLYVTVEAGVTWSQLYEALKPLGLRTPYWGTVSGFHATVGGSLSQGAAHFGCAEFESSAESCLGLDVVIADGTLLRTGSAASKHRPSPFYRSYGPDLTGLFLNDTGALGFKVRATLRLIPAPAHQRFASTAFATLEALLAAMAETSRRGLAAEIGGWSPELVRRFESASTDLQEDLKYLAGVLHSGTSLLAGVWDAAKIALAGRRDWKGSVFLMHVTIDEMSAAAAEEKLRAVEAIAATHGGRNIPASYPRAQHGRPFVDLRDAAFSSKKERSLPTHGLCPHSRAVAVAREMYAVFERHADLMQRHGIDWSLITSIVGRRTTLIEALITYRDPRGPHYARIPEGGAHPPHFGEADPRQLQTLREIRGDLNDMFLRHGCAHLQVGKSYPYREGREPATFALLQGMKRLVDPKGLVNPGSLGLAPPAP